MISRCNRLRERERGREREGGGGEKEQEGGRKSEGRGDSHSNLKALDHVLLLEGRGHHDGLVGDVGQGDMVGAVVAGGSCLAHDKH